MLLKLSQKHNAIDPYPDVLTEIEEELETLGPTILEPFFLFNTSTPMLRCLILMEVKAWQRLLCIKGIFMTFNGIMAMGGY